MCSPPCIAVAFPVDPYIRKEVLYLPTYWLHVFYMVLHWKIRLVLIARPYIPMCGAVNFSDVCFLPHRHDVKGFCLSTLDFIPHRQCRRVPPPFTLGFLPHRHNVKGFCPSVLGFLPHRQCRRVPPLRVGFSSMMLRGFPPSFTIKYI